MRTIFFGTPSLVLPCLRAVAAAHEAVAVVCRPDSPQGRSKKLVPPPAKVCAEELGIPVHQPEKLNDGTFEAWLRSMAPDLCVVFAYGRLLKQPILDVPAKGWLNVHPSLLPKYRGPSPIQSAILHGETETGVSIMDVVLEMDAGGILLQETTPIDPDDTSETLGERLAEMAAPLLVEGMNQVAAGTAVFTPQDPARVTTCPLFEKEHGRIAWDRSAEEIRNLVRAAQPWPVAQCRLRGEVYRVHRAAVLEEPAPESPGTITGVDKERFRVATGRGQLVVEVFQAPGKKALPVSEFLKGRRLEAGEQFEDMHACP